MITHMIKLALKEILLKHLAIIKSCFTNVSMAFTFSYSGNKLPVLTILLRNKPLRDFDVPDNVIILYKGNKKTLDSKVMKQTYINRVFMS